MSLTRVFPFALLALLLAGCAHVEVKVAEESNLYTDQTAAVSRMAVYAQPKSSPDGQLSALFLPFRVSAEMDHPRQIGSDSMQTFWQTWTGMEVLGTQVFEPGEFYFDREQAVRLGKEKGADLVVTGEISHYLHGGTQGDTSVSLRMDIFDARTGMMLWSLAQSGSYERTFDEDYIFVKRRMRMPADPMHALICHIASNMGEMVKKWSTARLPKS